MDSVLLTDFFVFNMVAKERLQRKPKIPACASHSIQISLREDALTNAEVSELPLLFCPFALFTPQQ